MRYSERFSLHFELGSGGLPLFSDDFYYDKIFRAPSNSEEDVKPLTVLPVTDDNQTHLESLGMLSKFVEFSESLGYWRIEYALFVPV